MKKLLFLTLASFLLCSAHTASSEDAICSRNCKKCECRCNCDQCGTNKNTYTLTKSDAVLSEFFEEGLVNIIRSDKETKVVLTVRSKYNNGWVFFSENTFLRDCETGDMYKVRRMGGNLPLAKTIYLNDVYGNVEFTMIFPPLGKEVKRIDYIQKNSNNDTRPIKGNNWEFKDLELSKYPRTSPKVIL